MHAACRHLIYENVHYASYACIAFKDTKTVHNGLVGVCRFHYTPNLRTINLSFEDIIIICTLFTKYWNKVCKLPKFTTQVVSQICKKGY